MGALLGLVQDRQEVIHRLLETFFALRLLRADDGLRAGLARWNEAGGDAAWLVDPNGFVVLRYAPGFDPGDLRSDLARLLKIN